MKAGRRRGSSGRRPSADRACPRAGTRRSRSMMLDSGTPSRSKPAMPSASRLREAITARLAAARSAAAEIRLRRRRRPRPDPCGPVAGGSRKRCVAREALRKMTCFWRIHTQRASSTKRRPAVEEGFLVFTLQPAARRAEESESAILGQRRTRAGGSCGRPCARRSCRPGGHRWPQKPPAGTARSAAARRRSHVCGRSTPNTVAADAAVDEGVGDTARRSAHGPAPGWSP